MDNHSKARNLSSCYVVLNTNLVGILRVFELFIGFLQPPCPADFAHGTRSIKHFSNLLERIALCFWKDKIRDSQDNHIKTTEEDVIMPPDIVQSNWIDKSQNN